MAATNENLFRRICHLRILGDVFLLSFVLAGITGCLKSSGPEVIVYTALDREFSEPILKDFENLTGIRVRAKYDSESTKTVGLTTAIIAESNKRTRCDLFWNNEIVNTIRIDNLNLLDAYRPAQADAYPDAFSSKHDRWFGFAARARVLIVNTDVVPTEKMPDSIYDLLKPGWKGQVGIAKPLFGSTATHAVCLFDVLGEEKAKEFFAGLKDNDVQILSGNKQVAEDVSSGKIAFGLTDTDDAMIELEGGQPVKVVYPDSANGQLGTLFIPNTLGLLRGGPNPEHARKLIDYLLTKKVEIALAHGESAQIPLHQDVQIDLRVETPTSIRAMPVDFESAAKRWDRVAEYLKENFATVK